MDKFAIKQTAGIFSQFSMQMMLLDNGGNCLIPDEDFRYTLPESVWSGEIIWQESRMFLYCPTPADCIITAQTDDCPQTRDIFVACKAMIMALAETNGNKNDLYYSVARLLQDEMSLPEIDATAAEFSLIPDQPRGVMVFQFTQGHHNTAQETLYDLTPRNSGDLLVPLDRHACAFIMEVSENTAAEELFQYAQALQETVLGETGLTFDIGIGKPVKDIHDLPQSYFQARKAIDIGKIFHPDHSIYLYQNMFLERFLSEQDPETATKYHNLLFNRSTARLFNDEMLGTIEMFFEKDLNLSDASRSLYIHRNTLVYRLDKIYNQTGLNLRHFEDAATFKLLMELGKCKDNQNK